MTTSSDPVPPAAAARPLWKTAALLAALGTLGPFAIDTYLPAFASIAQALGATPPQMQQTLSAYLLGFALMNLFHGALSDSFGRRRVVLAGVAAFTLASAGCALAESIGSLVFWRALQGMSAGAGMVVSRAIVRDLYPPELAQRVMSQITIFFGIAPALAPMTGGWLLEHAGWRAIFWLLTGIGVTLLAAMAWMLPETLAPQRRQPFAARPLLRGYAGLLRGRRFMLLVLASGVPFNGVFLYVLSAPAWLGDVLGLPPRHFFWFFLVSIGGIMGGAAISGRLAGRMRPRRQVAWGLGIMLAACLVNLALNLAMDLRVAPSGIALAFAPLGAFAFGWALMVPVVTLMALDEAPTRRGMASSLQACIGSLANAAVAGVLAPLVMHDARRLAWAQVALLAVGLLAWLLLKWWPGPGTAPAPTATEPTR